MQRLAGCCSTWVKMGLESEKQCFESCLSCTKYVTSRKLVSLLKHAYSYLQVTNIMSDLLVSLKIKYVKILAPNKGSKSVFMFSFYPFLTSFNLLIIIQVAVNKIYAP